MVNQNHTFNCLLIVAQSIERGFLTTLWQRLDWSKIKKSELLCVLNEVSCFLCPAGPTHVTYKSTRSKTSTKVGEAIVVNPINRIKTYCFPQLVSSNLEICTTLQQGYCNLVMKLKITEPLHHWGKGNLQKALRVS